MADNDNEGHNGATISQIASFAKASLPERPNVVLLHAGTNDLNEAIDPVNAPSRLGSLIDEIVAACPDAAVLVAQIIPSSNSNTEARIITYNDAIPEVIAQRADAGNHVMLVDMSAALTTGDLFDSLHPNDGGYKKMADVWYRGLQLANGAGWITEPVVVAPMDTLG